MIYILTLLFIAPFLNRKESRWFVSAYAFILLAAKEFRLFLDMAGADFFLFTSYIQVACMCGSVVLLEGNQRRFSVLLFFLYAVYNICIVTWWGYVPLLFYSWVGVAVIIIQTGLVTFKERGTLKNGFMFGIIWAISLLASRYT